MRGFLAGLLTVFLASSANADGVATAPFPTQVAGWKFGSSRAQAADICLKAGGTMTAAPGSADRFSCSVTPEPPSIAVSAPTSLYASTCGNSGICFVDMAWASLGRESAFRVVEALATKYGFPSNADASSTGLDALMALCKKDPIGTTEQSTMTWFFEGKNPKGERIVIGAVKYLARCNRQGQAFEVDVLYANQLWTATTTPSAPKATNF